MDPSFPGLGTAINVATVVLGALLGMAVGHRFPDRTRSVVTDCLGLTTLLMAGLSVVSVTDRALTAATGSGAPVLIVLGSLLIGSIAGSLLRIGDRLESLAGTIEGWFARRTPALADDDGPADAAHATTAREKFIEGWLSASLLFCVGPLTILGTLSDGLGRGIDQLLLKSVLDGFAALAFASTFGVGVLLSAGSVAVVQARSRWWASSWDPSSPSRTSSRSPRPVASCWPASAFDCCGSRTSRSPTCCRPSSSHRC